MATPEPASGPRSIIEELNAHRERRPASEAMRELDRTLAGLEKRLREMDPQTPRNTPAPSRPAPQDAAAGLAEIADNLRRRLDETEQETPARYVHSEAAAQALHRQLLDLNRKFQMPAPEEKSAADDNMLHRIDGRLNEISRALAAANRSRNPEREDALFRKLGDLSQRVDTIAQAAALPATVMDQLAHQIGLLASQVGRVTEKLSQTDYRAVEARLDAIGQKLEAAERRAQESAHPALLDTIDRRFAELTERLDAEFSRPAAGNDAFQALESRFDQLSQQISLGFLQAPHDGESEAIRNLEAQIANIARHLAQPVAELARISPRLDSIERSLETSRETVLEAAREAAESAVARMTRHGAQADTAIAHQLAEDMKSLEALARNAEERNSKTFETVHGTLVNIADRLVKLERDMNRPDGGGKSAPEADASAPSALRSPAAAAAQAARATVESEAASAPKEPVRRSLFGRLTVRANRADTPDRIDATSFDGAPAFDSEPALADPLEQPAIHAAPQADARFGGETMPDLHSIMKRVREERRQRENLAEDTLAAGGKADLISAARHAAQLAATESERIESGAAQDEGERTPATEGFFRRQRKPLLLAIGAVMIAMAGLQFGSVFLDRGEPADIAPPPQASAPEVASSDQAAEKIAAAAQEETPAPEIVEPHLEKTEPAPVEVQTAPETPAPERAAIPAIPEEAGPAALREAAAGGDDRALFEIGNRYMEGRGVTADFASAAQWYDIAAAHGFAPAQYRLGNFNEKGLGMPRDLEKARHWYELAARQGNASAMHNLAVLFATGANGTPDNQTAVRWFTEAADHGVKDSQFNLGILAAKGLGMTANLEESYKWFALAANAGDSDAAGKRDEIAKALKPEQLERAKATVAWWKARPLNEVANATDIPDAWTDAQPVATGSVDMKKAVRNIQLILRKNGYDAGTADGVMGAKTRSAIAAFQKANGLEATGEVDQDLVKLLLEKNG